ncbi:DNA anti-recombination protein RmuC [Duganella sp. SG902]|uniref:hypothetical protein n=1 Tax=Duganella sp. SG902 TaxID=2587016 RepID=UPI00159D5602|nr:hypothetical protein [Duganella sp. SG902]NVM78588.1 DNA anti-recombination protein RmuC [Duganella sp. SG902]
MMEERVAQLEAATGRNTAALAALENEMHSRFNRIATELSEQYMERRIIEFRADVDRRFTEMQENTDRRFMEMREDIAQRFDHVSKQFDQVDGRLDRMEGATENLRNDLQSFTRWMIGSQITVILALAAMAAKTFLN